MTHQSQCTHSSLNLFQSYPIDSSIEQGDWVNYEVANLASEANDFTISIEVDKYIDLSNTMLHITGVIKKKTSSGYDNWNDLMPVAPTNNFLSSLIKQVKISIGGKEVENTNSNYSLKAILSDLYNNNHEAKNTYLGSSMFFKDSAGEMENISMLRENSENKSAIAHNDGFIKRREMIIKSKGSFELMGPLHSDFFNTDRFLLPKAILTIKFLKNGSS